MNGRVRREEIEAQRLLETFFRERVDAAAQCHPGNDPPDLICETAMHRYAIEVTYVGQQETLEGKTAARMERDIPLWQMGQRLDNATKNIRKRDYRLWLQGPPKGKKFRRWEEVIKTAILDFVESGKKGRLELEGASVTAFGPGNRWLLAIEPRENAVTLSGARSDDIQANINDMLRHALSVKATKVTPLTGYDRKAILMWNTYPFGDELSDVQRAINGLREDSNFGSV